MGTGARGTSMSISTAGGRWGTTVSGRGRGGGDGHYWVRHGLAAGGWGTTVSRRGRGKGGW